MQRYVTFHLGFHCMPKYPFWCLQSSLYKGIKGQTTIGPGHEMLVCIVYPKKPSLMLKLRYPKEIEF